MRSLRFNIYKNIINIVPLYIVHYFIYMYIYIHILPEINIFSSHFWFLFLSHHLRKMLNKNHMAWSSHCGTTGLVASLEHWDIGSIHNPGQWVKDLALSQLWCRLQLQLGSGLGTPYATKYIKKKNNHMA